MRELVRMHNEMAGKLPFNEEIPVLVAGFFAFIHHPLSPPSTREKEVCYH